MLSYVCRSRNITTALRSTRTNTISAFISLATIFGACMAITCRKDICSKYLKRGPSSLRKGLVHTQDARTCRHNAATGIVSANECLLNPDNMLCPYRAKYAHALVLLHHLYFCLNSSSVTMRSPQPLPSRFPDASMSRSHMLFDRI